MMCVFKYFHSHSRKSNCVWYPTCMSCTLRFKSIVCTPTASHKLHHEIRAHNIKLQIFKELIFTYIYILFSFFYTRYEMMIRCMKTTFRFLVRAKVFECINGRATKNVRWAKRESKFVANIWHAFLDACDVSE